MVDPLVFPSGRTSRRVAYPIGASYSRAKHRNLLLSIPQSLGIHHEDSEEVLVEIRTRTMLLSRFPDV